MTLEQERFFKLLNQFPRVKGLWDMSKRELKDMDLKEDPDSVKIKKKLNPMSSGEKHMANFFLGLWMHSNSYFGFDLFEGIASIDPKCHKIIIEWVNDPFYP